MSASSDVNPDDAALTAETVVTLPADLHARPAGEISRLAATFEAEIELVRDARTAPAASVLLVMGLGARGGQQLTVRARGRQAAEAVAALTAALGRIA